MARAALTVQDIVITGLAPTEVAAETDGNMFENTGREYLHVDNADAAGITVTLLTPAKYKGIDLEDPTVSVPAGTVRLIGPFAPGAFTQTDGRVWVDYSAVANVTVAARKL